jgi:hypothetical protein
MMSYREQTPQIISILMRKLKPGKTFEDFQKAHLPPGPATQTEFGYDAEYFNTPARVIDAISAADPSIIISIGLSYGDPKTILQEVVQKIPLEKDRHEKIAAVADKIGPTQVLLVRGDNNFGGTHLTHVQLPLSDLTPDLIADINAIVPQK